MQNIKILNSYSGHYTHIIPSHFFGVLQTLKLAASNDHLYLTDI